MRQLWDHTKIHYTDRRDVNGRTVYTVTHHGEPVGCVSRGARKSDGWRYAEITEGKPTDVTAGTKWSPSHETRADAADHLLSARSPSAAWLS